MGAQGLELIEAWHLFPVGLDRLRIVVHPQSVIHSMVEYRDGSTLAQLGPSDMRVPIASCLAWPERMDTPCAPLDLAALGQLTFEAPDEVRFPATRLCREAAEAGGAAAWCRAASLAAHAGRGIGEMVALASRAAPGFACDPSPVEQRLRSESDLAETLAGVVGLPRVVTEAVAVGEATGTTAEALDRVADHLDEASARGFAAAVQALGFVAWAVVAGLVVTIVVGVVGGYARMIEGLARPR